MEIAASQEAHFFIFLSFWAILALIGAFRYGFFRLRATRPLPFITLPNLILAFLFFFLAQTIFYSVIAVILDALDVRGLISIAKYSSQIKSWVHLTSTFGGAFAVALYVFSVKPIWTALFTIKQLRQDMLLALAAWAISFPIVVFVARLLDLWIEYQFGIKPIEQVAVNQLKINMSHPALFTVTIFAIVGMAPFLEELLFRGLFQTWLRKFLSPFWAISLTSLIFSGFHFSTQQGLTNITFLSTLFILSCFLGLLYEKQRTLWSSMALHMFFNGINVSMIYAQAS